MVLAHGKREFVFSSTPPYREKKGEEYRPPIFLLYRYSNLVFSLVSVVQSSAQRMKQIVNSSDASTNPTTQNPIRNLIWTPF